eukprot:SAG25_NODE_6840_length_525_cov_1.183099_1_plen_79_part_10
MAVAADQLLAQLPPGSSLAVVSMRGSLCPMTRGHVRCFEEARALLMHSDLAGERYPVRRRQLPAPAPPAAAAPGPSWSL